jgi:hypothetical protein
VTYCNLCPHYALPPTVHTPRSATGRLPGNCPCGSSTFAAHCRVDKFGIQAPLRQLGAYENHVDVAY